MDSVGKNAIPLDSVGYQLNVLNNIHGITESPPVFECGYNKHRFITTNGNLRNLRRQGFAVDFAVGIAFGFADY